MLHEIVVMDGVGVMPHAMAVGDAVDKLQTQQQYSAAHDLVPQGKPIGYMIERHVTVADFRRLLQNRPDAIGLAVPDITPWLAGNGG
ncbi:MAG: DUF411 domain-containing protein [Paracoccaceae bacterium]